MLIEAKKVRDKLNNGEAITDKEAKLLELFYSPFSDKNNYNKNSFCKSC